MARRIKELAPIQPGDIGLLFNYDLDQLLGIFRAISQAKTNIEPKAWNRRFPAQVRVELIGDLQRVKDAAHILKSAGVILSPMSSSLPAPASPVQPRDTMETILTHFKMSLPGVLNS